MTPLYCQSEPTDRKQKTETSSIHFRPRDTFVVMSRTKDTRVQVWLFLGQISPPLLTAVRGVLAWPRTRQQYLCLASGQ